MKKFPFYLLLLFIVIIISGCGDDPVNTSNPVTRNFSGEWIGYDQLEINETQPDRPDDMCYLNIVQAGSSVSGEVLFLTSATPVKANFTGEVTGNVMNISFTDPDTGHIISFNMTYNDILQSSAADDHTVSAIWRNSTNSTTDDMSFSSLEEELDQIDTTKTNTYFLEKNGGTGTPVILVHGMTGSAERWDEWLPFLKSNGFYDKHEVWLYQYDWKAHISESGKDL